MEINNTTNLCDLLQQMPLLADAFRKKGVATAHFADCVTLGELAAWHIMSIAEVSREIQLLQVGGLYHEHTFAELPVMDVLAILRREHHDFLVHRLPRLSLVLKEISERKGQEQPELNALRDYFERFRADISEHILQEQDSLYAYATQLQEFLLGSLPAESVKQLLEGPSPCHHALRCDDDVSFFDQARYLTNHYSPPAGAGIMQRSLYRDLAQLERDLLRHEAVEFEVLLGKVVQLEDMAWQALGKQP
jgi:regulator of cell morphogenesis and NO signaling